MNMSATLLVTAEYWACLGTLSKRQQELYMEWWSCNESGQRECRKSLGCHGRSQEKPGSRKTSWEGPEK